MKKITAADLLRLGFERIDVLKEESGDEDYFYFVFLTPISEESLLITGDDDNEKDEYCVEFSELWDIIKINDLDDLESLVDILKRNIKTV